MSRRWFHMADGGRSTSKRPKQKQDCTVRALALATGVSYDVAYDFLMSWGRVSSQKFKMVDFLREAERSDITILDHHLVRHVFLAVKGKKRMSVGEFPKGHPTGKYIICQAKHVSAVLSGVVCDEEWNPERCVYTAYEFVRVKGSLNKSLKSITGRG